MERPPLPIAPQPTREGFIAIYGAMLRNEPGYDWTADVAKFHRFMASVRATIETSCNSWNIDSPVTAKAWRAIGKAGKPTYKSLRALPA